MGGGQQELFLQELNKAGAVITGDHFVYTSGRHGSVYVNKDAVYPSTQVIGGLCWWIANFFRQIGIGYEVVVGPAMGGIILAQWTAHHTQREEEEVLAVYAEKEGEGFVFRRGYDKLVIGRQVLVVEDILTTGGSVRKVVEAVQAIGGEVVAVAALCNRGGVSPEDVGNVPLLFSLVELGLESWTEEECPLCQQNVPVNEEVGKGREFMNRVRASRMI